MTGSLLRVLALVLLAASSISSARAQTDRRVGPSAPERDGGWLAFGVGAASDDDVSVVLTGNFGRERFVQIGFHGSGSLLGRREVSAYHVGAGISDVGRWHRTAIAIGPALVTGERLVGGEWDRFFTGGIVMSAQVIGTPIKEFGLGLDLFGHVNPVENGYGLALTFAFEANK